MSPGGITCNCKSEFKTVPCPVHNKTQGASYVNQSQVLIVADVNLVPDKIRTWKGHTFVCGTCKQESIMHFHNYCPNCGQKVLIQSKEVTELINKNVGITAPVSPASTASTNDVIG